MYAIEAAGILLSTASEGVEQKVWLDVWIGTRADARADPLVGGEEGAIHES